MSETSRSETSWFEGGLKAPAIVIAVGMLVLGLGMGIRQTFGIFLVPIADSLNILRGDVSLAFAAQQIIWGALTPIAGMFADRYGTGKSLVIGGIAYTLGCLTLATATSGADVHLGGGLLVGMGISAAGFPLVFSAVARSVSPERRSFALGVVATGGSIGQFILVPFAQILLDAVGWSTALIYMTILAALIVPSALIINGRPAPVAQSRDGAPKETILSSIAAATRNPGFLLLSVGFFVCGFHVSFIAHHMPGYILSCGLPEVLGGISIGIIGFFNIVGTFLAGWLGGRYRKKYLLALIYALRGVAIAYLMLAPKTELTIYVFSVSFGLLWLSTVPLTSGLVGDLMGPRFMATLFGIVMFSHQIGAFLGAWLGGLSFDLTGNYDSVLLISIALALVSAVVHLPIRDRPLGALAQPA